MLAMAATDEVTGKSYPEMIIAAIEALNEKNGSNKLAISKYLESKYRELPPTHATVLSAHLASMRESGKLVFVKNNYFRPGPGSPPKRGRGRPPKPKPEQPSAAALASPRPRGRPPKPKDPLAVAVAKAAAGLPRPRGRPPKPKDSPALAVTKAAVGLSRPRGRLPKAARPSASAATAPPAAADSVAVILGLVKRGRGRPPKMKPATATVI